MTAQLVQVMNPLCWIVVKLCSQAEKIRDGWKSRTESALPAKAPGVLKGTVQKGLPPDFPLMPRTRLQPQGTEAQARVSAAPSTRWPPGRLVSTSVLLCTVPSNKILAPLKAQLKGPLHFHLGRWSTLSVPPFDGCFRNSDFHAGRCESGDGWEGKARPG